VVLAIRGGPIAAGVSEINVGGLRGNVGGGTPRGDRPGRSTRDLQAAAWSDNPSRHRRENAAEHPLTQDSLKKSTGEKKFHHGEKREWPTVWPQHFTRGGMEKSTKRHLYKKKLNMRRGAQKKKRVLWPRKGEEGAATTFAWSGQERLGVSTWTDNPRLIGDSTKKGPEYWEQGPPQRIFDLLNKVRKKKKPGGVRPESRLNKKVCLPSDPIVNKGSH